MLTPEEREAINPDYCVSGLKKLMNHLYQLMTDEELACVYGAISLILDKNVEEWVFGQVRSETMVKVYGASDDLVEIENSNYKENEIGCYEQNVRIWFADGTIILVGYPKEDIGVWWIKIEKEGTAKHTLSECDDEDADIYSDIFEINSEIIKHKIIKKEN